jgi:hypothetical protein
MLATVEPLFKRGHELVVATYDYLLHNHETAAILGWEGGADAEHLSERRRFFTVWLARLLGMDFSNDLAHYLFRAGKLHAAHGPRRTHVPPIYVTGSISLVNAPLPASSWRGDARPPGAAGAGGLEQGADAAPAYDADGLSGQQGAGQRRFPRALRALWADAHCDRRAGVTMRLAKGADVEAALRKFFNYYPQPRRGLRHRMGRPASGWTARGTPWFTANRLLPSSPCGACCSTAKTSATSAGRQWNCTPATRCMFFRQEDRVGEGERGRGLKTGCSRPTAMNLQW